jgi:hypothetical protein
MLDQHVLKAASSAHERDVPLACLPDHGAHSVGIAVRGARAYDHGRCRGRNSSCVTDRIGRHDPDVDWNPSILRSMFERRDGRLVKPVPCGHVHQHSDYEGPHR